MINKVIRDDGATAEDRPLSYDERRGAVHGDHGAVHPAEEALHDQLDVSSGWTLQFL